MDTGSEVILVDTGLKIETPDFEKEPNMPLYTGEKIDNFVEALAKVGYKPEDVDKVILTHKHPDHSGELRLFDHAKIYISQTEADAMKLEDNRGVKIYDSSEQ